MDLVINDNIVDLLIRFGVNLIYLILIAVFAIYPGQREKEFAFTAVMMNVTTFFICFTLKKLEMAIGTAIGLFAVFEVLRYRTDTIRVKEMTYLFIAVGIAVINAFAEYSSGYAEMFIINSFIFIAAWLKESIVGNSPIKSKKKKKEKDNKDIDNGKDI